MSGSVVEIGVVIKPSFCTELDGAGPGMGTATIIERV
jgi:hypothetical protein